MLQQLLLFFHQKFCESLSCCKQWDIVYLDFCQAFDIVSHSESMSKLYNLGMHGDLGLWLRTYMYKTGNNVYVCVIQVQLTFLFSWGYPRGVWLGHFCFLHISMIYQTMFLHFYMCLLMMWNVLDPFPIMKIASYCRPISTHIAVGQDNGTWASRCLNVLCYNVQQAINTLPVNSK